MEKYFETRLDPSFRRDADRVWALIADNVLSRLEYPVQSVIDLGAGYGDFVNEVKVEEKWAVDQWPGFTKNLKANVRPIVGDITQLPTEIPENHFDLCFLSNVMEHFAIEDGSKILEQVRRLLKPQGYVAFLQPNFTYCYKNYFDDYTHKTAFTAEGFTNFLLDNGFEIKSCIPRYLPFSFKSRFPRPLWAVRLYLTLPIKPMAAQMLVIAKKKLEA